MKKKAAAYILRLFIQKTFALLCFLAGSGSYMTWRSYVYFGAVFALTAISVIITYKANPETLARRGRVMTDSPVWDKALLGAYWLLNFFVIYFIAGYKAAGTSGHTVLFWSGMALLVLSAAIATAALAVNAYLESTARIQAERGQTVVSEGVYGVVRHPVYSAGLLSCIGVFLVFPALPVLAAAVIIAGLTVARTFLEDKMLKKGLEGYGEYAERTKYILIPFIL